MQLPNKLPHTEHDLNIFTAHTTNQLKRRPENALLLALLFWVLLSGDAAPKTPEIQNNFKPSPVAIAYRLSSSKISSRSSSNRTSAAAGRQITAHATRHKLPPRCTKMPATMTNRRWSSVVRLSCVCVRLRGCVEPPSVQTHSTVTVDSVSVLPFLQ